jgi:hypothetical protein
VRDIRDKAEHFRNLAIKYHDMAKVARPAYLGNFFQNVAVRYVFMSQEASARANKETSRTAQATGPTNGMNICLHERRAKQDLQLLSVWADENSLAKN